jgi:cellulose synthase/poly-beta-1,6-N-acetylglucosamine synthase-like glycosyltransferase
MITDLLFLVISGLVILVDAFSIVFFFKKQTKKTLTVFPTVSILVAVRNEEQFILQCLKSLNQLDYPTEKLEILIGNDASTDNTRAIIEEFIQDKPTFKLVEIEQNLGKAIGKANVLAQLAHRACGEWLFFTDADMQHAPDWLKNMLAYANDKDLVTGFTWVKNKPLEAMEWVHTLGIAKIFSDFNLPATAMGNNMAIRRDAYHKTGGYENLPPSIVEDFALLQAVVEKKGSFINLINTEVLAYTQPNASLGSFLQQRKRWMQGAFRAPWYAKLYIFLRVGWMLSVLCLLFTNGMQAWILAIWTLKVVVQSVFIKVVLHTIQKKVNLLYFVFYELYTFAVTWLLLIYYFLPFRIRWKGRQYL